MGYSIDSEGTVALGARKVAVPRTVSAEARAYLANPPWKGEADHSGPRAMWEFRETFDAQLAGLNQFAASLYPVTLEKKVIGGIPCQIVSPPEIPASHRGRVLISLHAGGFVLGAPSLVEAIPVANLARIPVIAVDYRLAPEHAFPAAVDDVIAVYREVLKDHAPSNVGIYGSSAGGFITGQTVMRLQREKLPLPACCGIFSAGGNLADFGDSEQIYTLSGFWGDALLPLDHPLSEVRAYLGGANASDPLVSPVLGDLREFPPTLLVTGTRDAMLSSATLLHRALRRAGASAELFVFEAMPHSHWFALHLPEAREALQIMSGFFEEKLLGSSRPRS